jgi:hypothetical protein
MEKWTVKDQTYKNIWNYFTPSPFTNQSLITVILENCCFKSNLFRIRSSQVGIVPVFIIFSSKRNPEPTRVNATDCLSRRGGFRMTTGGRDLCYAGAEQSPSG